MGALFWRHFADIVVRLRLNAFTIRMLDSPPGFGWSRRCTGDSNRHRSPLHASTLPLSDTDTFIIISYPEAPS
jgi:hypothetical protein